MLMFAMTEHAMKEPWIRKGCTVMERDCWCVTQCAALSSGGNCVHTQTSKNFLGVLLTAAT